MDNTELTMIMMGGLLVLYWLIVVLEEEDAHGGTEPRYRYRPPIAYEQQDHDWSIDAGDWGDNESLAYLRFSRAEIERLIHELRLTEWVDSDRDHRYYSYYLKLQSTRPLGHCGDSAIVCWVFWPIGIPIISNKLAIIFSNRSYLFHHISIYSAK